MNEANFGSTRRVMNFLPCLLAAGMFLCAVKAAARPRSPEPPYPEINLTCSESFDLPYKTGVFDPNVFCEDWSGYSLNRSGQTVVPWVIPAIVSGKTNFDLCRGAFRFWVASDLGAGQGQPATLLELVSSTANTTAEWWSLISQGTNLLLACQTAQGETVCLSASIAWEPGTWHCVALCFTPTNSAIFSDGQLLAAGDGIPCVPAEMLPFTSLIVGSDYQGGHPAMGRMDLLRAYTGSSRSALRVGLPFGLETYRLAAYFSNRVERANLGPVTDVELAAWRQQRREATAARLATAMVADGGGMFELDGMDPLEAVSYPSGSLWLAAGNSQNGFLPVTVHGTIPGMRYDLQCAASLTNDIVWVLDQTLFGAQDQDWTSVQVSMTGRTNLFLRARSYIDGDGNGLPDWWELQYFGATGQDPYSMPAGDGWTLLQKYQNGWNPNVFYTPPAPTGLAVAFTGAPDSPTLTWNASPGSPTSYQIERYIPEYYETTCFSNVTSSATAFEDTSFPTLPPATGSASPRYRIRALYSGGFSAWSLPVAVFKAQNAIQAHIARGPGGRAILIASALPADAVILRLLCYTGFDPGDYFTEFIGSFDIPKTSITNGMFVLPETWVPPFGPTYYWLFQTVDANGQASEPNYTAAAEYNRQTPFFDGREQLAQNLAFLLRAANREQPFGFIWTDYETFSTVFTNPADYAYSSFFNHDAEAGYTSPAWPLEYGPFMWNHLYRNFVYTPADVGAWGRLTSGTYVDYYGDLYLDYPSRYLFELPIAPASPPALLSASQAQWTYYYPFYAGATQYGPTEDWSQIGLSFVTSSTPYQVVMAAAPTNLYGLSYQSVAMAWGSNGQQSATLTPDGSQTWHGGTFYPQAAQPVLQTVEYYFAPFRFGNISYYGLDWLAPLPGQPDFSITNTTPLLIAPLGDFWEGYALAGFARQTILNGDTNKPAYLQQYFDKAFKMDGNGNVTTNETGILSPYGEFFPTEPGPTALVTMTNWGENVRGTAVVHVVSLALDANHDGVMDLSWTGTDQTTQFKPLLMWINNDFDRGHTVDFTDHEQDDLSSTDPHADCPWNTGHPTPDCEYRDSNGSRVIPSERDLEDFARLWVCGVNTNLLSALPPGSTVTLSWGDAGNPNSANPTIDLFQVYESAGGIGYLTNLTTAGLQTNASICPYVGRLGPGQSIQLNSSQFPNRWAGEHFIWCGVSNGTGALTLTICDSNANTLAATTAYIQLKDIKQMYERWTAGDNGTKDPTSTAYMAVDDLPPYTTAFQYGSSTDPTTPYILHVHGWNMDPWDKDRYGETMFKRLYWQGYQGRFGIFRWPTKTGLTTFDASEFNAWKSGECLRRHLASLNTMYPGRVYLTAHSMGNVVAGEALRRAGTNQIVNTYIAMQGAIASHAYDPLTPTRTLDSTGINLDSGTPDCYANYYVATSPSYFSGSAGAGTYINFFNTNDWALTLLWRPDQDTKPDIGYHWDGVNFSKGGIPPYVLLLFPVDTYEIFSYCDEARSEALGAQINVGGVFTTSRQVELDALPFSFGSQHKFHSGQFRSDNAERHLFWNEVLEQLRLK